MWVSVWFAEFWLRIALLCFVLNNTSAVDIMIISSTTWNVGLLNLAICVGDVHSRNSFVDEKNTICHKTNIKNSASAIFHAPRSLFVASRLLRNSSQPFLGYMLHSSCELVPGCNKFKTRNPGHFSAVKALTWAPTLRAAGKPMICWLVFWRVGREVEGKKQCNQKT